MVEVVYLKKGERTPRSRGSVLIEVVSDRAQESIESGPNGAKLRVNKSNFQSTLADLRAKAEATAMQRIYVKGVSIDAA